MAGIISKLIGGSISEMAGGVAEAIDRFVETGEERAAAERLLMKIQQEPDKWQAEINKIEAGHRSLFVAGWRPFLGWISGLGIAWHFILRHVADMFIQLSGKSIDLPIIETGELLTLALAMLGMGAMRSYEKKNGLTK